MQIRLLLLLSILLFGTALSAQSFILQGTVFDSSRNYTVESVIVVSTGGASVITQKEGTYSIQVTDRDSVWFIFQNKPTIKYPVKGIHNASNFDISLRVSARGNNYRMLKEVIVRSRNYKLDSIRNRQDYARAFNFQRPNISSMSSMGPGGAGIDINEVIRIFQFRKNRNAVKLQSRLLQQEEDRAIDYRFNKTLIRSITGLNGQALDDFALRYRPSLEFVQNSSEYEFRLYIKMCFDAVSTGKLPQTPAQ